MSNLCNSGLSIGKSVNLALLRSDTRKCSICGFQGHPFRPVKLASYFMQMRSRSLTSNFNWPLYFFTFLFRGLLHNVFRLRNVGSYIA